jgi:IrrE N-terminal-like domain
MAKDFYTNDGLTYVQMAQVAQRYRNSFDIADVENVDVISIIEFKLHVVIPSFQFFVVGDDKLRSYAETTIVPPQIVMKKTIYRSASAGDAFSRFVIAHEIAHLLLHSKFQNETLHATPDSYVENIKNMSCKESVEDQADIFATNFLIPPKIAYKYRNNIKLLAEKTGSLFSRAFIAAKLSRRQEFYEMRNS